jgi:hypothetical protein
MDSNDVLLLQHVDEGRFRDQFSRARTAVLRAERTDAEDRWEGAARQVCGLLDFVIKEDELWEGLHDAVNALEGAQDQLHELRDHLAPFVDTEYELLIRRGLDDTAVGEIVHNVVSGLMSLESPTHHDIDSTHDAFTVLAGSLCSGVEDWSTFGEPERRARHHVNSIAVLGGAGGLLGTVTNAVGMAFPPFLVGSVAGGIAAAIASLRGWVRRP